jgi:hypothetical protein
LVMVQMIYFPLAQVDYECLVNITYSTLRCNGP